MTTDELYIFNIISYISKLRIKNEKIKISKKERDLIKKSYPGNKFRDVNGLRCYYSRWFNYVIYTSIDNMDSIENTIPYCLEKLKEQNG